MTEIVRFGPEESGNPEVDAFEAVAGTPAEQEIVKGLGFDKVRAALQLWTAGAHYGDIARQLQFASPRIAQMAVERALSEMVDDSTDKTKLRRRMSLTLDRFLKAITPKAIDPEHPEQLAAVRSGLAIVDRFARLHGLDEAVKVDIHMPGDQEFQRFVMAAAVGMGLETPVEADPFEYEDAEIVEDEADESAD